VAALRAAAARVDPTARFAGVLALLFVINLSGFVLEPAALP